MSFAKNTHDFDTAYAQLNDLQKHAVDTIEGPLLVLAGPGTGKTQVLTTRIANILKTTDTEPQAILALTFTDAAAKNMQQRLTTLIGETAYKVRMCTFHAFCGQVIAEHPEAFAFRVESEPLSDLERFQFLEEILHTLPLQKLTTIKSENHYFREIQSAISDLKREAISPEKLAELVKEEEAEFTNTQTELSATEQKKQQERLLKMADMVLVYQEYQHLLHLRKRFDYDDMISEVAARFQNNEELLLEYQERFTYFLVDEYQDTNAAQNTVVDQLAKYWGEEANVCVVGDPHQSIYRFQGASLENTMNFVERYPHAEVVRLEIGYRCPPAIYTSAAAVIARNTLPETVPNSAQTKQLLAELAKPLRSVSKQDQKIDILPCANQLAEALSVSERIQTLVKEGVQPKDIAVLYRDHQDFFELEMALRQRGIPYASDGARNVLQAPVVQQVIQLLESLAKLEKGDEDSQLFEVLTSPWSTVPGIAVFALSRLAGKNRVSIYEQILEGYLPLKKSFPSVLTETEFNAVVGEVNKWRGWLETRNTDLFVNWLQKIVTDSGLLNWIWEQPDRLLLLRQLSSFLHFVTQLNSSRPTLSLNEFLEILSTMAEHKIAVQLVSFSAATDQVTCSTVHSAKGKEWEYVFVIGCRDQKWGNKRKRRSVPLPTAILRHAELDTDDVDQDDRRLFYVALTRARRQLTLSYAEADVSAIKSKPLLPSFFISELLENTLNKQSSVESASLAETNELKLLLSPPPVLNIRDREKEFLKQLAAEYQLSFTGLNRYLENPRDFVLYDLLRLPSRQTPQMAYGTSMHRALEFLLRTWQEEHRWLELGDLYAVYLQTLNKQMLLPAETAKYVEQGKQQLDIYLHWIQALSLPPQPIGLEKTFQLVLPQQDGINLVGKIDRIDVLDADQKSVRVTDYKTGRDKSINAIQGASSTEDYTPRELALPESVRGRLKRQLLFYKLLVDQDPHFPYTVQDGVFEFVNESNGKISQRKIALQSNEVDDLIQLIGEVMSEIRSLQFLDVISSSAA